MKFEAHIPIFGEVKTPKSKTSKHSFCIVPTDFEILDLSEDDAALAFVVSDKNQNIKRDVRAHEGKLYCSQGVPLDEFIEKAFSARPLSKTRLLTEVVTKIKREASQAGSGLMPTGAATTLSQNREPSGEYSEKDMKFLDAARKLGSRIEITDNIQMIIDDYKQMIQKKLSDFIVIGDEVYQKSGEPVYKTGETKNGIFFTDVGIMNNVGDFTYSASSVDEYNEHCLERGLPSAEGFNIEVIDGSFLMWDAEAMDLDVFSRNLEANVRKGCSELYTQKDGDEGAVASPIMKADIYADKHLPSWKEFKSVLRSYNPIQGDQVSPLLEELVSSLVDEVKAHDQNSAVTDDKQKIWAPLNYDLAEKYISRAADSVINIDITSAATP